MGVKSSRAGQVSSLAGQVSSARGTHDFTAASLHLDGARADFAGE